MFNNTKTVYFRKVNKILKLESLVQKHKTLNMKDDLKVNILHPNNIASLLFWSIIFSIGLKHHQCFTKKKDLINT